jgi:hypothetical protein
MIELPNCPNSKQIEIILLEALNNCPTVLYLPHASQQLQKEYVRLNKLARLVSVLKSGDHKLFMIEEYQKQIEQYYYMCKKERYGTLEDLLKE